MRQKSKNAAAEFKTFVLDIDIPTFHRVKKAKGRRSLSFFVEQVASNLFAARPSRGGAGCKP